MDFLRNDGIRQSIRSTTNERESNLVVVVVVVRWAGIYLWWNGIIALDRSAIHDRSREEAVTLPSFHFFSIEIIRNCHKITINFIGNRTQAGKRTSNYSWQIRTRIVRLHFFSSSDFGRVHAQAHIIHTYTFSKSLTSSIIVFYILIWFSFVATRHRRYTQKMEMGGSKPTNNTYVCWVCVGPSNQIRQTPNVVIECKEGATQRIAGTKTKIGYQVEIAQ